MFEGIFAKLRQLIIGDDKKKDQENEYEEVDHDQVPLDGIDTRDMYGFQMGSPLLARRYYKTCGKRMHKMCAQALTLDALKREGTLMPYSRGWEVPQETRTKVEGVVKAGIPPQFRAELWMMLTGMSRKIPAFGASHIYEELLVNGRQDIVTSGAIRIDVTRTFPGSECESFAPKLERLLLAYSLKNPKLGYCQAMNFVAGALLIFMEEEEAFWMLAYMIEEVLPNYYDKTMEGVMIDFQVFDQLLKEELPELWVHFKRIDLTIPLLCTQWFLCLFITCLPNETAFIVWDSLMLRGSVVIFEMGLAILRMYKRFLLAYDNGVDAICFVSENLHALFDIELLWEYVHPINETVLQNMRQKIRLQTPQLQTVDPCPPNIRDLQTLTKFRPDELKMLWTEYINMDKYLQYEIVGIDYEAFARVIGCTFSEWGLDNIVLKRLFRLFDYNHDGHINFSDLVMGLSILCRGTFEEKADLTFALYDLGDEGFLTASKLKHMLISIFAPFYGPPFSAQISALLGMVLIEMNKDGKIYKEEFYEILHLLSSNWGAVFGTIKQIDMRKTFLYWVLMEDAPTQEERVRVEQARESFVSWHVRIAAMESEATKILGNKHFKNKKRISKLVINTSEDVRAKEQPSGISTVIVSSEMYNNLPLSPKYMHPLIVGAGASSV